MRTVTFKTIRDRIFRRRGLDPTAVTATQQGLVADFVTERVRKGWEYAFWKEWTYLEERAYRPLWYTDATYAAAEEVWDGATHYYSSIAAGNQGHAVTDTVYWTDITATMTKSILVAQPGKTIIGMVKNIYKTEADGQKDIRDLEYYISDDRYVVTDSRAGATVWVMLRKVAPSFTAEAWANTGGYAEGWVVYYPSTNETQVEGNCYMARKTEGNVEYWELMQIPEVLASYVVLGATTDYFRNDAQLERADALEPQADEELGRAYSAAMQQGGLFRTARIVIP